MSQFVFRYPDDGSADPTNELVQAWCAWMTRTYGAEGDQRHRSKVFRAAHCLNWGHREIHWVLAVEHRALRVDSAARVLVGPPHPAVLSWMEIAQGFGLGCHDMLTGRLVISGITMVEHLRALEVGMANERVAAVLAKL